MYRPFFYARHGANGNGFGEHGCMINNQSIEHDKY